MKTLYEANNAIEAQLIKNMLKQIHIDSHIHGDYLQGGIGDLQAFGLVRIMVMEDDYDEARALINDWQSAEIISE